MTRLNARKVERLQSNVKGEVILPSDDVYENARKIWNAAIDKHPGVIVRCSATSDVVHAVNFARDSKVVLAIRGGGHNIAGNALCDDGIVIDLSRMKAASVDPVARRVTIEGGATLADLDAATQRHGLATPVGINSTTGIAGLTLGGGFGQTLGQHEARACAVKSEPPIAIVASAHGRSAAPQAPRLPLVDGIPPHSPATAPRSGPRSDSRSVRPRRDDRPRGRSGNGLLQLAARAAGRRKREGDLSRCRDADARQAGAASGQGGSIGSNRAYPRGGRVPPNRRLRGKSRFRARLRSGPRSAGPGRPLGTDTPLVETRLARALFRAHRARLGKRLRRQRRDREGGGLHDRSVGGRQEDPVRPPEANARFRQGRPGCESDAQGRGALRGSLPNLERSSHSTSRRPIPPACMRTMR